MLKSEKFAGKNGIFATRLKKIMKERGITQQQLADCLNITRQAVSLYLTGQALPDIERLTMICTRLGVSSDYLIDLSDVATTDVNIKNICDYTGLSTKAIEQIYDTKINSDSSIVMLDTLLKDDGFYELVDTMQQIIDKYDESIYIGSVVLDTLKSIPNIKEIFTDFCEDNEHLGKWFNDAIGEENYKKIEDAIGSETIPYLKNYVARKSNRHSQKRAKEMEEYFDDESIVDIALMRIDELRYDIKIDQFFVSKNADDLLNYIIEEEGLEAERDKIYNKIADYFRGDAGDSECPQ